MDDQATVLPPFTVTQRATDAIEQLGGAVRIDLEQGGCCGTAYAFSLTDAVEAGDEVYGCPGSRLYVSAAAGAVVRGATLDHAPALKPPRFRITANPNVGQSCPCRRSFGRPWPGPRQPQCRAYLPMPWDEQYEPPRDWQRQTGWPRQRPE